MKNSTSQTSVIKDIAVFDYVRGEQSEDIRMNFENLLKNDADLLKEVHNEKRLRETLVTVSKDIDAEPVQMQNFDSLLERIELKEAQGAGNEIFAGKMRDNNVPNKQGWHWKNQFSIAASIVFFAMIGFIGIDQTTQPSFTTLSNQEASTELDFTGLVEQRRLAKLKFTHGLASSDIAEILEYHQLNSIQSGALGQAFLVSSVKTIDAMQLSILQADKRIEAVELLSFSND